MRNSRTRRRPTLPATLCLLALLGVSSSAIAREVKVPEPMLDAAAAREFPQAIFDKIIDRITYQTTLSQLSPNGLIRWWPRTTKLVEFVKAPSRTYPDTYLFAMRYLISVLSDEDSLAVYSTSCQVVVVYKYGEYDEPTVVCEPVNLDRPGSTS